ncbi:MAG: hypothetical protein SFV51_04465 [Bryobacteraceae bacterium]|nr:hypothetical protein [Bryobacteraceae bacterium]
MQGLADMYVHLKGMPWSELNGLFAANDVTTVRGRSSTDGYVAESMGRGLEHA